MDDICTLDALWDAAKDSEMKKTLSPDEESACTLAHDPHLERQSKARTRFLRTRPDGIAHNKEKKTWFLLEFKRTSDVRTDYLERKEALANKQYDNFMSILRRAKGQGWVSEQLNFIVGSKSIDEAVMDKNLDKIGINPKNKKRIKDATAKTNIHSLLNILKAYYANVHQLKKNPTPTQTDSTDRLQQTLETRKTLGKRPNHQTHAQEEPHTHDPPTKRYSTGLETHSHKDTYTTLIPRVDYYEGPPQTTQNKHPTKAHRLLAVPTRNESKAETTHPHKH